MLLSHLRLHFGGGISVRDGHLRVGRFWLSGCHHADLVGWNYGKYDGRLTSETLADNPDWELLARAHLAVPALSRARFARLTFAGKQWTSLNRDFALME